MVLREILETRRGKVTGDSRRLQNKKLYDLYFSPTIIWATESRRMR
jgi:hypothetical protein